MDETDFTRVKMNRRIAIASWSSVFQITFYRAAHRRQLYTNLMMTAGFWFYFQKKVAFAFADKAVIKLGFLSRFIIFTYYFRPVFCFVFNHIIHRCTLLV